MDDTAKTNYKEETETETLQTLEKESIGKMKNQESTCVEPSAEAKPEARKMDNPQLIQTNKRKKTEPETEQELEKETTVGKIKIKKSTYVEASSEPKQEKIKVKINNLKLIVTNKQKKIKPETSQASEDLENENISKIKKNELPYVEPASGEIKGRILNKRKQIVSEISLPSKKLKIEINKENKKNKIELTYVEPPSGSTSVKITRRSSNKQNKTESETSLISVKLTETKKGNKRKKDKSSSETKVEIKEAFSNKRKETELKTSKKLKKGTEKGAKRKKIEKIYVKPTSISEQTEIETLANNNKEISKISQKSEILINKIDDKKKNKQSGKLKKVINNKRKETDLICVEPLLGSSTSNEMKVILPIKINLNKLEILQTPKKSEKQTRGTRKKTELTHIEASSESKQTKIKTLANKKKEISQKSEISINKINDKKKNKESGNLKEAISNKIKETDLICVEPLLGSSTSNEIKEILPNKNNENETEILQTPEKSDKQTRGTRKKTELTHIEALSGPTKAETEGRLSNYEKIDLFNGLIQHGSSDIPLLHTYVPNKSEENIKRFVYSNKRVARYALSEGKDKAPIDKWLDFLQTEPDRDKEKLHDLSRALKYIALFEPCANESESMLSDCYKLLSDCMKGDSPKHLNPVTSLYLHAEINRLIKIWKTDDCSREHKHLEVYNKKKSCYAGKKKSPTDNPAINPSISNPLKIPDSLLELKK